MQWSGTKLPGPLFMLDTSTQLLTPTLSPDGGEGDVDAPLPHRGRGPRSPAEAGWRRVRGQTLASGRPPAVLYVVDQDVLAKVVRVSEEDATAIDLCHRLDELGHHRL